MTLPFSDELISAWLDDELNDSRSAEIQVAVENDPVLARRVNQLRVLSSILKSLPVEPIPVGFHDLVVEATVGVVRDPVPSVGLPGGRDVSKRANKFTSTKQRWWFGVVGLVSTAALVLVTINLTGENENTDHRMARSAVATDSLANEMELMPAEATTSDVAADESASKIIDVAGRPAADAGMPATSGNAAAGQMPAYDVSQLTFAEPIHDVDVGDVIQAINQSGDEMTVVKLTVVDVSASVDRLEVLLAAHDGAMVRAGGMIMVEANYQQLAECFRELQQQDLYEQMLVASRNVDSRDFAGIDMARLTPSPTRTQSKTDISRPVPGAVGRQQDSAKSIPGSPIAGSPIAGSSSAGSPIPGSPSATAEKLAARAARPGQVDEEDRSPKDKRQSDSTKPIRLLIVLEPSPARETNEGNGSIINFQAVYGPIG